MKLYAHLYRTRGKWLLVLTDGIGRPMNAFREFHNVSGKKEARRIAAEHNAICWNF